MSLLKRAMEGARSEEEIAAAQAIAALSEDPQEAAQGDFSTDPLTGYDAAQIALRLFEAGRLDDFSGFMKDKSLSPNIVLPNGLTLLQNSLFRFPQDNARLECLLQLGANPNLFMRKIEEEGFASGVHRATYHPLNYAFANCPQRTTPEICRTLRKYGASADGLRNYFEVDPATAAPDDEAKAKLRKELIATTPNAELAKAARRDVDLSVMQKHLANIEAQFAQAGFQVVSYVPPKKAKVRSAGLDAMIPIFENFRIVTDDQIMSEFRNSRSQADHVGKFVAGYSGFQEFPNAWQYFNEGQNNLKPHLIVELTSSDPQEVFGWLPQGASAGTSGQNQALAALKPVKMIAIKSIGQDFSCVLVGVYKDKNNISFFFDPSINNIRTMSDDGKQISLGDRSDIMDGISTTVNYIEVRESKGGGSQNLKLEKKTAKIDTSHRPGDPVNGAGAATHPNP